MSKDSQSLVRKSPLIDPIPTPNREAFVAWVKAERQRGRRSCSWGGMLQTYLMAYLQRRGYSMRVSAAIRAAGVYDPEGKRPKPESNRKSSVWPDRRWERGVWWDLNEKRFGYHFSVYRGEDGPSEDSCGYVTLGHGEFEPWVAEVHALEAPLRWGVYFNEYLDELIEKLDAVSVAA